MAMCGSVAVTVSETGLYANGFHNWIINEAISAMYGPAAMSEDSTLCGFLVW